MKVVLGLPILSYWEMFIASLVVPFPNKLPLLGKDLFQQFLFPNKFPLLGKDLFQQFPNTSAALPFPNYRFVPIFHLNSPQIKGEFLLSQ